LDPLPPGCGCRWHPQITHHCQATLARVRRRRDHHHRSCNKFRCSRRPSIRLALRFLRVHVLAFLLVLPLIPTSSLFRRSIFSISHAHFFSSSSSSASSPRPAYNISGLHVQLVALFVSHPFTSVLAANVSKPPQTSRSLLVSQDQKSRMGRTTSSKMPESNYYAASASSPTFSKAKLPFSWPSILNPIPRRYRRRLRSKFRSAISPASSIAKIETSFDPRDTIKALRQHRWSYYDGQYLFLIILAIFSLSISQAPGPMMKCAAATALMAALLVPITRQFFLPALPILSWVFLFFNARYVHFLNLFFRHSLH
jgi:hypothetical protein